MKIFADPRVKYISLSDCIKNTDFFSNSSDYLENSFCYLTESFCIIEVFRTVFTNFGMDLEDRFDHFVIALRDGKTEYEAINKRIEELKAQVKKDPKNNKFKYALRKYKNQIKDIPDYIAYSPAKSGNCFDESLTAVDYNSEAEFAKEYVVLDVETNGLSRKNDDLLSISIYDPFKKVCYNRFLPLDMQPAVATSHINGITNSDLKNRLHINQEEANKIIDYFNLSQRTILVYGPDDFDALFVRNYFERHGLNGFDNLRFENIKKYIPSGVFDLAGTVSKDNMCKLFGIEGVKDIHSGLNDCLLEWKLFEKFKLYKPIRINNNYYSFNNNYVVPITVLIQNPKIFQYADIPVRYVLGNTTNVFSYEVSKETLEKIKKFDTNITGISLENMIYANLKAKQQNNSSFLIKNKMQLERIARIDTAVNEIPIVVSDDGLIEAVEKKDEAFIKKVNNVALALKDELKPTFDFIKNNVFVDEDILSQELVLSENDKVLAICDLSSKSAVMEIKTVYPSSSNIGYLDSKITYQLFYQAKGRDAYYLHIYIGESFDKHKSASSCTINIYKVELEELSKEEYEKMMRKLTLQEEDFLEYIKKNPGCQYKDLEKEFSCFSRRMIENRIKSLEKKKYIVKTGNNVNYHWDLIPQDEKEK